MTKAISIITIKESRKMAQRNESYINKYQKIVEKWHKKSRVARTSEVIATI